MGSLSLLNISMISSTTDVHLLIHQFAKVLELDADYLYYLVGRIPEDICRLPLNEAEVAEGMKTLRDAKKSKKR
jgi:hypothetical protein